MKLTSISLVITVVLSVMWSEASIGSPRVFVLFGGFGSCALSGDPAVMTMAPQFQDAVAQATINDSQDPLFYQVCYAVGSGTLFYQRPDGRGFVEIEPL